MNYNNNDDNRIRRKKVSSSANKSTTSKSANSNSPRTKSSKKKSSKKKDKFKALRVTGIVLLVMLVCLSAAGTGLVFASLRDVQPVTKALLDEKTYQTTEIRYANGDLLSNAPSVNKKDPIKIDQIPKDIINAVVSIEDERFYEHNGVDIKGLLRSVVKTLTGNKQGGSTIPMQVSKMLLTTDKQTLTRKIKDIYYATQMDKFMTKDEILCTYLNNVYFGKSAYGVGKASKVYFGKNVQDLTLAQSAMLVGITNNPAKYKEHREAKKRQEVILYKMKELGYIDEEEYSQAISEKVPFKSEIE